MPLDAPRVVQLRHTATDDNKFSLTSNHLYFREVNIHITDNDARYGDTNVDSSNPSIAVGNGASFQDVDLSSIFFINSTGGSNATVTAIGVLMTEGRKKELGI
jgi:hypothetical protein